MISFYLILFSIQSTISIRIGLISNATYLSSNINQIHLNLTCMECTCMATASGAVGWNCNNKCQLIMNYSSNDIGLIQSNGAYFLLQQLPPGYSSGGTSISPSTLSTIPGSVILHSVTGSTTQTNQWIIYTLSYQAKISTNVTIKFYFQASAKYYWYLDDVSIKDPFSNEKITNNKFENSPSLTGWTSGYSTFCPLSVGSSSSEYHSSNKSYYNSCGMGSSWISQSFTVLNGQIYNVSFWLYKKEIPFMTGDAYVNVTIN
ncbi:hypothetical protein I4U23_023114 [Adineta vaga]|nr:hypothetical protein I4U23_023114 [Adineta vaga]